MEGDDKKGATTSAARRLSRARGLRRRRGGEARRTRRPEGRRQAVLRRSREGGEAYFRARRLLHPLTAVRVRNVDAGRKRHARKHSYTVPGEAAPHRPLEP